MAVTPPVMPDLSGAYGNIQRALQTGANIALETPGTLSGAAAITAPLAEELKTRREQLFKAQLEDHLNQNKVTYAAQAEGKTLTTPEDYGELAKQFGISPDKIKSIVSNKGVWQTPEEKYKLAGALKRSQIIETMASDKETKGDAVGANLMRLFARSEGSEADQLIARLNGISQVEAYTDPVTKTIKYRDKMTKMPLDLGGGISTPSPTSNANDLPTLRRIDQKQADGLEALGKSAQTDTLLKGHAKGLDELNQLEKLIKANIPGSKINIGADTASAIGGVPGGRFSSLLSSTEGSDPSIVGRTGQYFETRVTGKLSDNNQQKLLQQVAIVKAQKKFDISSALDDKTNQAKVIAPYASDKLIETTLKGGYQRYLQEDKKPIDVKTKEDYDNLKPGTPFTFNGQSLIKQ